MEAARKQEEDNVEKLTSSDGIVEKPRRKWTVLDKRTAGTILVVHLLSLLAPFHYNWAAFCVAFGLYVATILFGITVTFHRSLAHKSYKLPKWLEYSFAYLGAQALQGDPIDWVSTHRYHHQFVDTDRDPHSPLNGFWFSHITWLFDSYKLTKRVCPKNVEDLKGRVAKRKGFSTYLVGHIQYGTPNNVEDLLKQPFYRFLRRTYVLHPIALAFVLYALGGLPFVVWGMGVRLVWSLHITFLVNSVCHIWGYRLWNTKDLSKNNWAVALVTFGEGWHNNHHAFEYSARHGLQWWEFDFTWWVVLILQALGLATDVKLPSKLQKQKLAI